MGISRVQDELLRGEMDEAAKGYCQGSPKPCLNGPENCEIRSYFKENSISIPFVCPIEEGPDEFTEDRYKALEGAKLIRK